MYDETFLWTRVLFALRLQTIMAFSFNDCKPLVDQPIASPESAVALLSIITFVSIHSCGRI